MHRRVGNSPKSNKKRIKLQRQFIASAVEIQYLPTSHLSSDVMNYQRCELFKVHYLVRDISPEEGCLE